MVLPKMNMEAKAPDQVFKLEDFFETKEENANSTELDDYKYMARGFFGTHSTMDKLCELGMFNINLLLIFIHNFQEFPNSLLFESWNLIAQMTCVQQRL